MYIFSDDDLESNHIQPTSTNPFLGSSSAVHAFEMSDSKNPATIVSSFDPIKTESDEQILENFSKNEDYGALFDIRNLSSSSKEIDEKNRSPFSVRNSSNNLLQSPNQTNIGTTIAGVVGGGASKLQALHKWFKGDSFDGREFSKKKNELSELASVSVRDLVKAIGGQDGIKSNGNDLTPPHQSRSSSPVADLQSGRGSSSKSIEISDRSIFVSSLAKDISPLSNHSSYKDDCAELPFLGLSESQNSQNAQNDSSSIRKVAQDSPKYSPRKQRIKRTTAVSSTTGCQNTVYNNSFEDKQMHSPTAQSSQSFTFDSTQSNFNYGIHDEINMETVCVSKRALPSSLAESLRAVFAAFVWHEGESCSFFV